MDNAYAVGESFVKLYKFNYLDKITKYKMDNKCIYANNGTKWLT